jgi:hypothetical protein
MINLSKSDLLVIYSKIYDFNVVSRRLGITDKRFILDVLNLLEGGGVLKRIDENLIENW